MHVTLASVALLLIGTAMTLEAHRSSTNQAYRSVRRKGVAVFARQSSVQLAEERIEHRGQTRDAIDRWILEDDATVELRRRMRVSIVRAPASKARLQCILRGQIGEGRNAKH